MPVPAIHQDPGKGGKKKKWQLSREADQAEEPARMRQLIDRPAQRDLLHPRPDQGNTLSSEIEAKIPVSECADHGAQGAGFRLITHFRSPDGQKRPLHTTLGPSHAPASRAN